MREKVIFTKLFRGNTFGGINFLTCWYIVLVQQKVLANGVTSEVSASITTTNSYASKGFSDSFALEFEREFSGAFLGASFGIFGLAFNSNCCTILCVKATTASGRSVETVERIIT